MNSVNLFRPVDVEGDKATAPVLPLGVAAAPTTTAFNRLQKKLRRQVSHAIRDFNMIE